MTVILSYTPLCDNRKQITKMAAGMDVLKIALIVFGIIIRLSQYNTPNCALLIVKPENLAFYACTTILDEGRNDFAIEILFPTVINLKNENGRPVKSTHKQHITVNSATYCLTLFILLSGDIHYNPGPIKYPCTECIKPVRSNQKAIQCDFCNFWTHLKCTNISLAEYNFLSRNDDYFYCDRCNDRLPNFTDSFFASGVNMESELNATPNSPEVNNSCIFDHLRVARSKSANKFRLAHLNINSLRYKFDEIKPIMTDNLVDFLIISETKLDNSFRDSLFKADGFKLQRRDRDAHGGGLAVWIREDIASRRRSDLESGQLESIVYEVLLDNCKWLVYNIYRPPSLPNETFHSACTKMIDKGSQQCDNYIVIGDLNNDMKSIDKSQTLEDICDLYDMDNIVSEPTCYKSNYDPSLVDVIITNKPDMCDKPVNISTGISDCHHLISTCIKSKLLTRYIKAKKMYL